MRSRPTRLEYLFVVAATVFVIAVTRWLQTPTTFNGGLGWDDVVYHDMARRVADGAELRGGVPFVYRIGLPFIAAKLAPDDLRFGFLAVSLPMIVLISLAFHVLLARFVASPWARLLCFVAFVTQFHGLARFIPFRNFMVDAPAVLVVFAGLWLVLKWREQPGWRWSTALALLTTCGVWMREAALVPALALLFAGQPLRFQGWRPTISLRFCANQLLPIVCGFSMYVVVRHSVIPEGNVGVAAQFGEFAMLARVKLPTALPLGWLITFGPVLVLPILAYRSSGRFLAQRQELAAALAALGLMAWVGGSDTERLLFYAAPIVFVLIGRTLDAIEPKRELIWLVPLMALQAVSERWFWTLPDHGPPGGFPLLTVVGAATSYDQIWSCHTTRELRAALLLEHLAVVGGFFFWVRARKCTPGGAEPVAGSRTRADAEAVH